MKKEKRFAGKAQHLGAAVLAAGMLWGVGMQANAATLKDVFDEQFYVERNPGVAEVYGYGRESLWGHFAKQGMKEGRLMNNLLDIVAYRKNNPDLEVAFGDDGDAYLNHYLTIGITGSRTVWNRLS